LTTL
jgi:hypothetical protein